MRAITIAPAPRGRALREPQEPRPAASAGSCGRLASA